MTDPYLRFGPLALHSYTALIMLAAAAAAFILLLRAPPGRRAPRADAALAALAGALLGGRALHVLLHWSYFAYHTAEIPQIQAGGLSWQGALLGGLLGLAAAARWRGLSLRTLLDDLAPALPLLALGGWAGCQLAHCAYGQEVATLAAYPPLLVHEGPDVFGLVAPRYHTQLIGLAAAALLLTFTALLFWRGWLAGRRFWLLLALLALLMFALAFLRGDEALQLAGLRADQWLDLAIFTTGVILAIIKR